MKLVSCKQCRYTIKYAGDLDFPSTWKDGLCERCQELCMSGEFYDTGAKATNRLREKIWTKVSVLV